MSKTFYKFVFILAIHNADLMLLILFYVAVFIGPRLFTQTRVRAAAVRHIVLHY